MADRFPIVGVGASAGGVEALESLFQGMPPLPGAAFVVITHLAPKRESMLPEILARDTRMPVAFAEHGLKVQSNHVYVTPGDGVSSIKDGVLQIRSASEVRERNPIDTFFSSLAEDQGEYAIGIVLSGSGSDGTLGVKAIKEHGGLTMAQAADGSGPRHSGMPESAIASGVVDVAATVEMMPDKLLNYVRGFDKLKKVDEQQDADGQRKTICAILADQTGHDFAGYKTRTFYRRLERRMLILQLPTLAGYAARLREDPAEVDILFRDLLIGVTNFFRDVKAFEALEKLVLPQLFEGKGAQDTIRVWVPGCATGEEVYSLAIMLREESERHRPRAKIQLFATDIDDAALAVARSARYPANLIDGVSKERRERFFAPEGSGYQVSKAIRDMCVFSSHSVVRDPPFSKIDLISCRNLLIYLNAELQGHVIPVFHYALRPGGYLFLGTSENITQHSDLFSPVDRKNRVFQRRDNGGAPLPPLPLLFRRNQATMGENREPVARSLRQTIDARVLDHFVPPHVAVTRDGDVVYFSQRTGKFLEPPPGRPSRSLMAMARKGLRLPLRAALHEAVEKGHRVIKDNIPVEGDEHTEHVRILVEPMRDNGQESLYLVVFNEVRPPPPREPEPKGKRRKAQPPDPNIERLDRELRETRERLQSMMEEYETAIEELKSSNEEMVSVNEELQSTNEELETSKEELQSVNEELQTVNNELTLKIEELDGANSDLRNLYESTDIAAIFLDREIRIRSFTPAVTRIFNLIQSDRGRPLTDIAHRLDYGDLHRDIQGVLQNQQATERRTGVKDGSAHYIVRVLPYRGGNGQFAGAVLTFHDVTSLS